MLDGIVFLSNRIPDNAANPVRPQARIVREAAQEIEHDLPIAITKVRPAQPSGRELPPGCECVSGALAVA